MGPVENHLRSGITQEKMEETRVSSHQDTALPDISRTVCADSNLLLGRIEVVSGHFWSNQNTRILFGIARHKVKGRWVPSQDFHRWRVGRRKRVPGGIVNSCG